MNEEYTHISMVIDRSGSMNFCWNDVVGGYEQIIKENKSTPGICTFTVAAFDTVYELIEDFTDIQQVNEKLEVYPRGGTALLDAIGKTIVSVGERFAKMKEEDRPSKVIMLIQTDGEENSSKEYRTEYIKQLIEEHTDVWKWQFQFLGADLNSVNEAKSWGIKAVNTSVYNTKNSLDTFSLVGSKMATMRCASSVQEYSAAASFSEDDKKILKNLK